MKEIQLKVENLFVAYEKKDVLKNINFELKKGGSPSSRT